MKGGVSDQSKKKKKVLKDRWSLGQGCILYMEKISKVSTTTATAKLVLVEVVALVRGSFT